MLPAVWTSGCANITKKSLEDRLILIISASGVKTTLLRVLAIRPKPEWDGSVCCGACVRIVMFT